MEAAASGQGLDRRDDLRRRIYLLCLVAGIPVLSATWAVKRAEDGFIEVAYPPYVLSLALVGVLIAARRLSIRRAERVVIAGTIATFLGGLAVAMLGAGDLAQLHDEMTVSSLLTVNLMAMLAYVTFDTSQALRASLGIFGTFVVVVGIRLVPEALAGRPPVESVDYLRAMMFLGASVGMLHVLAQVKDQAADARSAAAAMAALANTDALTGLANRRRLRDALDEHVARTEGDDEPLAVVLLDLDHFKAINDRHGHDAGDAVLQAVAATLGQVVSDPDLLGRWGGEEFLIVATGRTATAPGALAERCRVALAASLVPPVGRVTASFGVAVRRRGEDAGGLLQRADRALYEAKARGRDRVAHHDDRARGLPAGA